MLLTSSLVFGLVLCIMAVNPASAQQQSADPLRPLRQALAVHSMDIRVSTSKPSLVVFRDGWIWTTRVASFRRLPKSYAWLYAGIPHLEFTDDEVLLELEGYWDFDAPHPAPYYADVVRAVKEFCAANGLRFTLWRPGIDFP